VSAVPARRRRCPFTPQGYLPGVEMQFGGKNFCREVRSGLSNNDAFIDKRLSCEKAF
jgi:hypothetical protein